MVKSKALCSLLLTDIGKSEAYFYKSEILFKASVANLLKHLSLIFSLGTLIDITATFTKQIAVSFI